MDFTRSTLNCQRFSDSLVKFQKMKIESQKESSEINKQTKQTKIERERERERHPREIVKIYNL